MKTLPIGVDSKGKTFALPLEVVTEKLAFIGRTGSGKTYGATKLAELMLDAGAQIVAVDPVGVWRGLRMGGSYPIYIFGGLSGDFPLEPTAGAMMADLIVDRGISVVLDISQFETDADKARFCAAFGDRFFFRKKASPSAVHVFVEECQEVVPQNPQKGEERMLHAWQRICKIGRNFGIGVSLVSQRPQEANKKALNQAGTIFVFNLTGPQERKAVEGWIADQGVTVEDLQGLLPKIEVGKPHVWSPTFLRCSETVQIGLKKTPDVSSTPKVGQASASKELTPIDGKKLMADMAATIERAKENDPRELKTKISRLHAEIAKLESAAKLKAQVVAAPARSANEAKLKKLLKDAMNIIAKINVENFKIEGLRAEEIQQALNAAATQIGKQAEAKLAEPIKALARLEAQAKALTAHITAILEGDMTVDVTVEHRQAFVASPSAPARAVRPPVASASGGTLGKAERKVLTVLAQHPDGCEKGKLALLSGYTYSGGFRNTLSVLRTAGLLVGGNEEVMVITQEGLSELGDYDPMPTGQALRDYWLGNPLFGSAERAVLSALFHGFQGDGPQLAAELGREYSGGFRNTLSTLRTAGVIVGKNTGTISLNPELAG